MSYPLRYDRGMKLKKIATSRIDNGTQTASLGNQSVRLCSGLFGFVRDKFFFPKKSGIHSIRLNRLVRPRSLHFAPFGALLKSLIATPAPQFCLEKRCGGGQAVQRGPQHFGQLCPSTFTCFLTT